MTKISQLTNIGSALAADDEFVVRDVSDVSTPNKKVTSSGIIDYIIAQGGVSGFSQIAAGVGPLARALATSSGATGTLTFSTAAATTLVERMRITSAGNVGIGTSSPDTALHINGAFDSSSAFATTNSNKGLTINSSLSDATGVQYGVVFSTSQNSNTDYPVAGIMAIPVAPGGGIGGSLSFQTHTSADTTLIERARIDSAGRVLVGTSTANTSGAKLQTSDGLTFPATQVASADPNTLDDYEEGTWTPVLTDGTNNATTNIGTAQYTKIGNVVHLMCYLLTTSLGSVTGALRISGLPFTVSSNSYSAVTVGFAQGLSIAAGQSISIYPTPSQTYIQLFLWDATDGPTALQASEWTADGGTIFSISYRV